jgi:flagellar basal body-associated protein FliL
MTLAGVDPKNPASYALSSMCPGKVLCGDGSCRSNSKDCGIIPRCPLGQYRCPDGFCAQPTDPKVNPCTAQGHSVQACPSTGTTNFARCEDGTCRPIQCDKNGKNCQSTCLQYDGCGLQYPYACPLNRECAVTSNGCTIAGLGNPALKANRRLLQTQAQITTPCLPGQNGVDFCMAEVKAANTIVTVDTTESSSVDIALDPNGVPRLSLKFSSGSFVLKDSQTITGVTIRPVGESRMRYAVNEIHASRKIQFGGFLPFSTTVLSPGFECEVDQNVEEPFNINVTVQAYFDQRPGIVNASDICLARLVELPGFTTWRCLFPSAEDRAGPDGPFYVLKNQQLPVGAVESVISFCTPQTETDTGVQATANGTAYAFIWSPLPNKPQPPEGRDVIQKNIVWIILGVLLGIAGLVLLTYCAFRLYRYRNKYKEQKEEADRLQEEVENMRQFGGEAGNKDDQVNMTANPLAVQLKDVQAKFNEEDLKLQEAEANLRKQEGEIRQEHIRNMRENRDQLASQLEKLKRQLAETQAAQAPKATYDEDNQGGASYTTDEPVREEFDGGSTGSGAQPRRQKRDL